MNEIEAGKLLVELYADYERLSNKLYYGVNKKYAEAVAMAIMALKSKEDDNQ